MAAISSASTMLGGSSASLTGAALIVGSGTLLGSSSMEQNNIQEGQSSMLGSSSMTGTGYILKSGGATMLGTSLFQHGIALQSWGTSFASMTPQVVTPVKAITMGPKVFRWLQLLQRGDLSIFFCDGGGNFSPIAVVYSLYFVRPNGSRQPVGPQHKTPVSGDVGEFYAVGRAGESGQPGNWVIEWKYQRSTVYPVEVVEMPFQVFDAVLTQDPYDVTGRKVKFGWN